jgi:anti-anti-sigma factor
MSFSTRFESLVAPSARVLHLAGRVDAVSAAILDEALIAGLGPDGEPLLVDFSGIEYISSMGLRSVLMAAKRSRHQPHRLVLAALRPNVREVFEISGFLSILEVAETLDEAHARLAS